MKQFYVTPEYVEKYGTLVGRARDAAEHAKEYAEKYAEISAGEQGWLALLGDSHKMIMDALSAELEGLKKYCESGSEALEKAAKFYSHTDQAAAAKVDGTVTAYNDRQSYTSSHYRDGGWVAQ